jgi:hypothetical protein
MKTDSNGLAVFLDATQGVKAHYHAPYAMPSLIAEAGKRAPKFKRAASRRMRNYILAYAAAAFIIIAGFTVRLPASAVGPLQGLTANVNPNVWQALSVFAFSGTKIDSQGGLQEKIDSAAEAAYMLYAADVSVHMFEKMTLPEDIRQSIRCRIVDDHFGPDMRRAAGKIGGLNLRGLQIEIDQAQFGWKFIRDELGSIGGLPLNSRVKPFSELTPSEKALLAPSFACQAYLGGESSAHETDYWTLGSFLCEVAALYPNRQVTAADLVKSWVGPNAYVASRDAAKAFTKEEAARWLAKNFLVQVASPVTGKLFEPNHREFSRGNGYVVEITDKALIAKLKAAVISSGQLIDLWDYAPASKDHDWSRLDRCRWCYFRLYGEDLVIAEGVSFSEWGSFDEYYSANPTDSYSRIGFMPPTFMYNPVSLMPERREELRAMINATKRPAPDYKEWLASRTHDELAQIAWQLNYKPGGAFTTKEIKNFPVGKTLPKIETPDCVVLGSYNGLTSTDVKGLPTGDPISKNPDSADERDYLVSSSLGGRTAPIRWFAEKGVMRITTHEEWCKLAYTKEQLQEIIRASTTGGANAATAKVKEIGLPYTTLGQDLFLPIYRDFEPYQGYFERVDTPALREKARKELGKQPKDMIYFRIYGAERVIAEGVWVR